MAESTNFNAIPEPDQSVAGRNNPTIGSFPLRKIASQYRPSGAIEPDISTLARFSGRLINMKTGEAWAADEILLGLGVVGADGFLSQAIAPSFGKMRPFSSGFSASPDSQYFDLTDEDFGVTEPFAGEKFVRLSVWFSSGNYGEYVFTIVKPDATLTYGKTYQKIAGAGESWFSLGGGTPPAIVVNYTTGPDVSFIARMHTY